MLETGFRRLPFGRAASSEPYWRRALTGPRIAHPRTIPRCVRESFFRQTLYNVEHNRVATLWARSGSSFVAPARVFFIFRQRRHERKDWIWLRKAALHRQGPLRRRDGHRVMSAGMTSVGAPRTFPVEQRLRFRVRRIGRYAVRFRHRHHLRCVSRWSRRNSG